MPQRRFVYRIDAGDRVVRVNRHFEEFADENGAEGLGRRVLGTSLFAHVHGAEVVQLYRRLLERLRREGRVFRGRIRCDAAPARVVMDLEIEPFPDRSVEFRSRALRTELRDPVALLDRSRPRSRRTVVVCSWCQRVRAGRWVEAEAAIEALGLVEDEPLPRISHGICERCRDQVLAMLDRGEA